MVLATQPKLLLLDEPLAGAGAEETQRLVALLRSLRGGFGLLLVEHDMQAVFALADRIRSLSLAESSSPGHPTRSAITRRCGRRIWLGQDLLA